MSMDEQDKDPDWDRNISETLKTMRMPAIRDELAEQLELEQAEAAGVGEGGADAGVDAASDADLEAASDESAPAPNPGPRADALVPEQPPEPPASAAVPPPPGRRRTQFLAMGAVAVLGVGLLAFALWPSGPAQPTPAASEPGSGTTAIDLPTLVASAEARRQAASAQDADGASNAEVPAGNALAPVPPASGTVDDGPRVAVLEAQVAQLEAELEALRTRNRALTRAEESARAERTRLAAELEAALASQGTAQDAAERLEQARAQAQVQDSAAAVPSTSPATAAPASAMNAVTSAPGPWTVSLMTLSRRAGADAFAERVRGAGWPARVGETGRDGGLWRISSGRFGTRGEAENHAAAVAAALELEGVWVTRETP